MNEFQFADIIILALIAGFIALRLRNTLGKDVGHRPDMTKMRTPATAKDKEERVIPLPGMKTPPISAKEAEDTPKDEAFEALEDAPLKSRFETVKKTDSSFRLDEFLEGAKSAYEWVLKGFNEGDEKLLKQLLSKEVYSEFSEAINGRKEADEKSEITLVSIDKAEPFLAEVKGSTIRIGIRFHSDQIHLTRDKNDKIIAGDVSAITRVDDEWVFERNVKSRDPNWVIIDT